jgi:long-chain acyl-CoA synthetase
MRINDVTTDTSFAKEMLAELNPDGYTSLVERFVEACRTYASQPAFNCLGQDLTFAELEQKTRDFAAWLLSDGGLQAGDRLAVQLPNLIQYPVVAWGAIRAGVILVNTNPLYTERELVHQFNDSGAKKLVVLADLLPLVEKVIPQTGVEQVIVTNALDMIQPQPAPDSSIASLVSLPEVLAAGADKALPDVSLSMDSTLVLQYTGGTTGVAKGAVLTHANFFACAKQVERAADIWEEGKEIFIAPLPIYHVYGFNTYLMGMIFRGGMSVLIPNPRDLDAMMTAMKPYRFTGFAGINTLFVSMLNHPMIGDVDFSALKLTISGGSALMMDVAKKWEQKTGCRISEGYGLSETAATVSFNRPGFQQVGTIGEPIPCTQVKIVDAEGEEVSEGEEGELLARGPQIMRGYWNRPEATAEAIDEQGWFKTGDIAVRQPDGYLKIVDRKKDMIIVSGFNVYPNEIEDIASSHDGVLECAAVGVDDEKSGEAVKLFVVKANPDLTADNLRDHCRQQLTAYKVPKHIEFLEELPKSNVGKILRRELRT